MDEKDPKKVAAANARAKALPPERRSDIGKQAAAARWGAKATHKGNFREEFGIDVECYVLDDETKTAVISQRGMGLALGFSEGGSRLPSFVRGKRITEYVGRELREKLENPIIFQSQAAGAGTPFGKTFGYDVTILIDLCKSIIKAEGDGKLAPSQVNIARQAHVIVTASAKAGIKQLVYALSGYDAPREEIIAEFKRFVREEARDYEREFPNQLYKEWYRLYRLPQPERGRAWKFKQLTLTQVYEPLARSSGRILELIRAQKVSRSDGSKLHQFLSDVGVKALRTHLGQLLGIAQVSPSRSDYERHVQRIFGTQFELDI